MMKLFDYFGGLFALLFINVLDIINNLEPILKFSGQTIIGILTIILLIKRIKNNER